MNKSAILRFRWEGKSGCPLCQELPHGGDGHLLLLQVHDLDLGDSGTLVKLLREFLSGHSRILRLLAEHGCILGGGVDE